MCVCEAESATMTAALPAVWSTASESISTDPLSPMDNPDKTEEKSCGDQAAEVRCDSSAKFLTAKPSCPNGDKNHNNFPISIETISEGDCIGSNVNKIDSETLDLRKNSSVDSVEPNAIEVTKDNENRNSVSKHVKKSTSSLSKIRNGSPSSSGDEEEYFKPLKKLRMLPSTQGLKPDNTIQEGHVLDQQQPVSSSSRVKSFSITDILRNSSNASSNTPQRTEDKHTPHLVPSSNSNRIVRPWDTDDEQTEDYEDEMSISSQSSSAESPRPSSSGPRLGDSLSKEGNPLDALFQMTSKTFEGLKKGVNADGSGNPLLFSAKQSSKKKRKSRTAFSNHQIFELEKRFLYQKYLSPADRDELALTLGLSNAQVITWFQNRRAKLKRDMEELKKDVHTATLLGDHTAFIKTMTQMGLLKTKPMDLFACRK